MEIDDSMKMFRLKSTAAAMIGALVVVGSGIGVAAAQQAPATNTPPAKGAVRAQFINALASRLSISVDQLKQAASAARQNVGLPAHGGLAVGGRKQAKGYEFQAVATLFGETSPQLQAELPGNSFADLASKHGHTASDVVTALTNTANQRISQAQSAGRITPDKANHRESRISQRVSQAVNFKFPANFGQRSRQ
jgi:hypothetical protein